MHEDPFHRKPSTWKCSRLRGAACKSFQRVSTLPHCVKAQVDPALCRSGYLPWGAGSSARDKDSQRRILEKFQDCQMGLSHTCCCDDSPHGDQQFDQEGRYALNKARHWVERSEGQLKSAHQPLVLAPGLPHFRPPPVSGKRNLIDRLLKASWAGPPYPSVEA